MRATRDEDVNDSRAESLVVHSFIHSLSYAFSGVWTRWTETHTISSCFVLVLLHSGATWTCSVEMNSSAPQKKTFAVLISVQKTRLVHSHLPPEPTS